MQDLCRPGVVVLNDTKLNFGSLQRREMRTRTKDGDDPLQTESEALKPQKWAQAGYVRNDSCVLNHMLC